MEHFCAPEQMAVYMLDLCASKTAGLCVYVRV